MRTAQENRARFRSGGATAAVGLVFCALGVLAGCGGDTGGGDTTSAPSESRRTTATGATTGSDADAASFTLTSAAFDDGQPIPELYTCDGEDVSPPLAWSGAPEGTVQLALVVDDPDAPGGTFTHWVVWGIDPAGGGAAEGEVPDGAIKGKNDFGKTAYGGPCPPSGTHHYRFELLALSADPQLGAGASVTDLRAAVDETVLGGAVLTGTYER